MFVDAMQKPMSRLDQEMQFSQEKKEIRRRARELIGGTARPKG
jgi:hypothetical protein